MTPEDIARATLAKCSGNDPWFPKPSESVVLAWAEHIERHRLDWPCMSEAVTLAYEQNGAGFRPLPKDVIEFARKVRRERAERETAVERGAREDRMDRRLEMMIQQFADRRSIDG